MQRLPKKTIRPFVAKSVTKGDDKRVYDGPVKKIPRAATRMPLAIKRTPM